MIALLAFLGSVVELAEIPTIIWLVVTLLKLREENKELRLATKEAFYSAGIKTEGL